MLLLLDPLLKSHLHDLQDIGQVQTVLRHTDFNTVLRSLPNEELEILRNACIAKSHSLIPSQGPTMNDGHFLKGGAPGLPMSFLCMAG